VRVESSSVIDANVEFCDTCNRYFVAPTEEFQVNVTVVGWFDDPLPGDERTGAAGDETNVVKLLVAE
jgi:hypothetical protein